MESNHATEPAETSLSGKSVNSPGTLATQLKAKRTAAATAKSEAKVSMRADVERAVVTGPADSVARVRLAADGTMYLCLGQQERLSFGPLLRRGASDLEIVEALRSAMSLKPERHEFNEKPEKILRIMAATGG